MKYKAYVESSSLVLAVSAIVTERLAIKVAAKVTPCKNLLRYLASDHDTSTAKPSLLLSRNLPVI